MKTTINYLSKFSSINNKTNDIVQKNHINDHITLKTEEILQTY